MLVLADDIASEPVGLVGGRPRRARLERLEVVEVVAFRGTGHRRPVVVALGNGAP
jgi:hypothetical protein